MQDAGAAYPGVKAAIDGLVDANWLAGDTGEHVAGIFLVDPLVCHTDGLRISVHERAPQ